MEVPELLTFFRACYEPRIVGFEASLADVTLHRHGEQSIIRGRHPVLSYRAQMKRRPPSNAGPGELPPAPESIRAQRFRNLLMRWYRAHARVLPWRGIHDPYATWLSEIMLQQTRVATVIDRYGEFLRRFPTLQALAEAKEDDVLALWSGLGYYRRARMLHRGAQFVVREMEGKLPRTSAELRTLPGVGEYTAAAIGSIAFGERIAVVDGNVDRVLSRLLGLREDRSAAGKARILAEAQKLVPPAAKPDKSATTMGAATQPNPPGDHNQAMMELGATICLPRQPMCLQCPVVSLCRTRGEHATEPRGRQQSRLAVHLLALRKHGCVAEVLLERRAADASLMAGMLELPPLPPAAVEGREPVLRLRHAITNTNYVVQVYSEAAYGPAGGPAEKEQAAEESSAAQPALPGLADEPKLSNAALPNPSRNLGEEEDFVFEAGGPIEPEPPHGRSLLAELPVAASDLEWVAVNRLWVQPLTGLARKCLQRLRLMSADIRRPR